MIDKYTKSLTCAKKERVIYMVKYKWYDSIKTSSYYYYKKFNDSLNNEICKESYMSKKEKNYMWSNINNMISL